MNAATAHSATSAGSEIMTLLTGFWWLILLFGGAILEFVAEKFDAGIGALRRRARLRHKRRMDLKRMELRIARASAAAPTLPPGYVPPSAALRAPPAPGPCRHRKAVPVRNNDGDVLAWLCKSCDTQLPADFSVYEEDL